MKKIIKRYITNTTWFRKEMYKAYKHGQKFDINHDCTEPSLDKDLPWTDWFNKHYLDK